MSCRCLAVALAFLGSVRAHAQEPVVLKQPGWVGAVAIAADNRRLAVGTSDGAVAIWDLERGTRLESSRRHQDAVAALAFSPGGEVLASGGHDGLVAKGTRRLTTHRGPVMSLAFAPKGDALLGDALLIGGMDGTVRVWAGGLVTTTLREHTSWVNSLAIDRAGTMLASASSDNTIQVRADTFKLLSTFRVKEGEIRSVAISPDGKLLAAGIRYGGLRVWDLQSQEEVTFQKAHKGETWAVAFTPDGRYLASGGGDWNQPGEVHLWDVQTWKQHRTLPHSGEVLCLAISPNGRYLAAGSWDRTVRIWRL